MVFKFLIHGIARIDTERLLADSYSPDFDAGVSESDLPQIIRGKRKAAWRNRGLAQRRDGIIDEEVLL